MEYKYYPVKYLTIPIKKNALSTAGVPTEVRTANLPTVGLQRYWYIDCCVRKSWVICLSYRRNSKKEFYESEAYLFMVTHENEQPYLVV